MALKILVNSLFGGGAEIQAALLVKALKPEAFLLLDTEGAHALESRTFRVFQNAALHCREP